MKKNEGRGDRWLRIIFGALLLMFAFGPGSGVGAVLAAVVGLAAVATGFFGWCPAYSLMGVSTCPRE